MVLEIIGNINFTSSWASLPNYTSASSWPWYDYRTQIKIIHIIGVNTIPQYCFSNFTNLWGIILDGINTISNRAFQNCGKEGNAGSGQGNIIIGGGVKNLNTRCFQGCNFEKVVLTGHPNGTVASDILFSSKINDIYYPFSSTDSIIANTNSWGAYGPTGSGSYPTEHPYSYVG